MKRILSLCLLLCLLLSACTARTETAEATPDSASATPAATEKPTAAPTEPPTVKPTESPTAEETAQKKIKAILKGKLKNDSASIAVGELYQYPELPTGCEAVALTMAINALGNDLGKTEIAENDLEYNDNYAIGYCGDPASDNGAGIWPIGVVRTVENFAARTGATVYAYNTSKQKLYDLCKLIDAGCPVLVWTTYYMNEPVYKDHEEGFGVEYDGEFYQWYDNEHCVTLCGYDLNAGTVDIADPLRGIVTVDAERFERINAAIGGYSVALTDTSEK